MVCSMEAYIDPSMSRRVGFHSFCASHTSFMSEVCVRNPGELRRVRMLQHDQNSGAVTIPGSDIAVGARVQLLIRIFSRSNGEVLICCKQKQM